MTTAATARPNRSELGLAALLGVVGVVAIVDALGLTSATTTSDPVGPKAMPIAVGILLLVCAVVLALQVLRGGAAEPDAGEDIDPTSAFDWKTLALLVGFFLLNAALINQLGWVISGAIMFWGSCWALGSRRWIVNIFISLALTLATYYGFYFGLGIKLPAGILTGIL
ncbi:tripartite tricarboxylate transporter TctB family protein [Galactobacter valiniphilus]|uniref:Tripartite tricarboxylate transporter TctB family protein n=1 Tax=Galactobacter valiniphilus TaxID=2676122 RepID=A0A399JAH1_9MICC|nr:tripartite tricarboxylate transporter TctB family protein [Galactobacter valiniphilus]RII41199.1 tripartite tricarboxylate transporter TctB family protein [Galactobacter valiniphilus]